LHKRSELSDRRRAEKKEMVGGFARLYYGICRKRQKRGTNKLVLTLKEGMNIDFGIWNK
jgi:hypothetical protein